MHTSCGFAFRFMSRCSLFLTVVALLFLNTYCHAQFEEDKSAVEKSGPQYDKPVTKKMKIGVKVTAEGGPCTGLRATMPIPMNWPEQTVKIGEEKNSPAVRNVTYVTNGSGTVRQMIVQIPAIRGGETVEAMTTFEIQRSTVLPPDKTTDYKIIPYDKLTNELKKYLGESPFIEVNNSKIAQLAKEIPSDKADWDKVEAIYDLVRTKVEYKNGPLKGAVKALTDGTGDCEELSSLFIALCRQQKIPSRTVWVKGHCYPEFYLQDEASKGFWFPCQAAGTRAFGGIPELRPILQKGDNFADPDRPRERLRYLSEFAKGFNTKGNGVPRFEFVQMEISE